VYEVLVFLEFLVYFKSFLKFTQLLAFKPKANAQIIQTYVLILVL